MKIWRCFDFARVGLRHRRPPTATIVVNIKVGVLLSMCSTKRSQLSITYLG